MVVYEERPVFIWRKKKHAINRQGEQYNNAKLLAINWKQADIEVVRRK